MPEMRPMLSIVAGLLAQVPPTEASLKTDAAPRHALRLPDIGKGKGFTVNVVVVKQPVASLYVITTVPSATPFTIPVAGTTVASVTSPLLQVPPVLASVSAVVAPTHSPEAPVMLSGKGSTVNTDVVIQPVGKM